MTKHKPYFGPLKRPKIKITESKPTSYEDVEVAYTYEEIREMFDDDQNTLVIQLLNRIEELEWSLGVSKEYCE